MKSKFGTKIDGGASISKGVMYGFRPAKAYSRYELLDVTPEDGLTRDQWAWAQYQRQVVIDGFSERMNAGDSALADIMEIKKKQAEEALGSKLESDIFAASQATGSFVPLPLIVLGSGSVGDINGSTATWWASTVSSSGAWLSAGRAATASLINLLEKYNPVGMPTCLLSDKTAYEAYEESLLAGYQYANLNDADAGRTKALTYKGLPWVWSSQGNSGVIYVLSKSAIEFAIHSGTDFIMTPFVRPADQDARVGQILLTCALVTHNRRKLGKVTGVTA
jgi:hypothetical protein